MPYLTPDETAETKNICIEIRQEFYAFLIGALIPLTNEELWEQEGDLTISECAKYFIDLIVSIPGNCGESQVEVGTISMFATDPPSGWLECNGNAVSRTTYADLFAAIGTTFGSGDGTTTFNLPDMRDNFPVGRGSDDLGDTGGEATHQLTIGELPSHNHTYGVYNSSGTPATAEAYAIYPLSLNTNRNTSSVGSNQGHNNIPPFLALVFAIKH